MPFKSSAARATGKRGRPSKEEERTISLAILDSALRLFLELGYGATSMKRIGEEAGVAPNTLYARFPDKEVLFKAIVEWKIALWKVTNPPRYAPPGASLEEALKVAVLAIFEAMDREDISALGRLLTLEAERFPEMAIIYRDIAITVGHDGLVSSIRHSRDCNLSEDDIRNLARTLLECVTGHMHLRRLNGVEAESHRRAASRIARVFTSHRDCGQRS